MDTIARIQQDFLQGLALTMQGNAVMLRAFNQLVRLARPTATGLYPTFSAPTPKPEGM